MHIRTASKPLRLGMAVAQLILATPAFATPIPQAEPSTIPSSAATILTKNNEFDATVQFANAKKLLVNNGTADDLQAGLSWLQRAAAQGYAPALFELANLYENGTYVKQDNAKAVSFYEQAAKQGHLDSQYNLGLLYLRIIKDTDKGRYWLEQAAKQQDAEAQYNLALLYRFTKDKQADPVKAIYWKYVV